MLQLFALVAAALTVMLRTARAERQLLVAFVCALPFTPVGALALDYALRVVPYAANHFAGAAPRLGGAMAYGALLGLALAYALLVHVMAGSARRRADCAIVARALDRVAPAFGVLLFVGRIGCFIEGCEHGRPTTLPWAIRYASSHPRFGLLVGEGLAHAGAPWSLGLHPTPLYEALIAAVAALAACRVEKRALRPGCAFATSAMVYAVARFAVEALRGDAERGHASPFTTGQAMSLFVACLVVFWWSSPRSRPEIERARSEPRRHRIPGSPPDPSEGARCGRRVHPPAVDVRAGAAFVQPGERDR